MAIVGQSLRVHVLDVGQGEAIVLDLPDGSFALLDGGPSAEASVVLDEIEARHVAGKPFRLAGITQWDKDHIYGIPAVLKRFRPDVFYLPGIDLHLLEQVAHTAEGAPDRTLADQVRNSIRKLRPSRLRQFTAPNLLPEFADVEAYVLSPMPNVATEISENIASGSSSAVSSRLARFRNRASVALWLRYAERVLFLAGEADGDQYRSMETYFLKGFGGLRMHRKNHAADWIKLSHHGADTNNPDDLFKRFAKSGFVGSASAGGGYNHPHPSALKRLHVDHGGIALCTNLGKGCSRLLTEKKLDRKLPESWTKGLRKRPNPEKPCYRKITVTITDTGQCSIETQTVQTRCPYGGPVDGKHVW